MSCLMSDSNFSVAGGIDIGNDVTFSLRIARIAAYYGRMYFSRLVYNSCIRVARSVDQLGRVLLDYAQFEASIAEYNRTTVIIRFAKFIAIQAHAYFLLKQIYVFCRRYGDQCNLL